MRYIDHKKMGRSEWGWLDSHLHFSFAEYYNPNNIHFGVLRVLNDDMVQPGTGFAMHPHEDFEILSYVVDGELTHADSLGNQHTLKRGQVQYMSAGTGITHSEHNWGSHTLRFLQIWFFPDKKGHTPNYSDYRFKWEERKNRWLPIASGDRNPKFPIQIHADIHTYASEIAEGDAISFTVNKGRQAYLVLIDGEIKTADITMHTRDALEIIEENMTIYANKNSHMFIIEMHKE